MASSKAKVGVNSETNSLKESKSNATGSAGEASPNNRIYSLDELETIATVELCSACRRGGGETGYVPGCDGSAVMLPAHFLTLDMYKS
ncbi:hypothetical protein L3Q82_000718 [Scortum barcoo]|uniref:Uncharacterized protein n=1 Tax=Scortum barcoo TaxID=214431 RepID=A0ACB8WDT7_9TELE|nr:hypothetical protein L3Q82_000718 [Scortum barcoo]